MAHLVGWLKVLRARIDSRSDVGGDGGDTDDPDVGGDGDGGVPVCRGARRTVRVQGCVALILVLAAAAGWQSQVAHASEQNGQPELGIPLAVLAGQGAITRVIIATRLLRGLSATTSQGGGCSAGRDIGFAEPPSPILHLVLSDIYFVLS